MRGPKATRIELTDSQRSGLEKIVRGQKSEKRLVTRASVILAAAKGEATQQIAQQLCLDEKTVRKWRNRWADAMTRLSSVEAQTQEPKPLFDAMISVLIDAPRLGAPAKFTAKQIVSIVAISLSPPAESGRPINRWSQRELADEAIKRKVVKTISPRSVGRFLKSGGFKTASQSIL